MNTQSAVLKLAREEAIRLGHRYVGTEHLLLGILNVNDPGVASLLDASGITRAMVRNKLEQALPIGSEGVRDPETPLPYTSRAKAVLRLAAAEGRPAEDGEPTGLELLQAILREEHNIAAHVLRDLNVRHEID
jgi:ATP-dependent Clp protease ATP-binding subunit ClpC